MRLSTPLATLALMASTTLAAVSLVHNKCDFNVWVTAVGVTPGKTIRLSPNGAYWTQKQFMDDEDVGTAVKITQSEKGLWENKPVLHFSYSKNEKDSIYYDLSSHNGFDFWGKKLRIHGPEGKNVDEIVWNGQPKPNRTLVYFGETDLVLELCE